MKATLPTISIRIEIKDNKNEKRKKKSYGINRKKDKISKKSGGRGEFMPNVTRRNFFPFQIVSF